MRKLIAAINMTLDGFCDHMVMTAADEELHRHYADLLNNAGAVLYGRITYQLMEYWQTVVKEPTGTKATDDFAVIMDRTPKIVFSRTLKNITWQSARLATRGLEEEVVALRQQPGKDILVGSPGLIVSLANLDLVDEYQICVHPVIAGGGLPLFKDIHDKAILQLVETKTFRSGAIALSYVPEKRNR